MYIIVISNSTKATLMNISVTTNNNNYSMLKSFHLPTLSFMT